MTRYASSPLSVLDSPPVIRLGVSPWFRGGFGSCMSAQSYCLDGPVTFKMKRESGNVAALMPRAGLQGRSYVTGGDLARVSTSPLPETASVCMPSTAISGAYGIYTYKNES